MQMNQKNLDNFNIDVRQNQSKSKASIFLDKSKQKLLSPDASRIVFGSMDQPKKISEMHSKKSDNKHITKLNLSTKLDENLNTENSNKISNSNTNSNIYKKKIYNMLNSSRRKERENEFTKEKDILLHM